MLPPPGKTRPIEFLPHASSNFCHVYYALALEFFFIKMLPTEAVSSILAINVVCHQWSQCSQKPWPYTTMTLKINSHVIMMQLSILVPYQKRFMTMKMPPMIPASRFRYLPLRPRDDSLDAFVPARAPAFQQLKPSASRHRLKIFVNDFSRTKGRPDAAAFDYLLMMLFYISGLYHLTFLGISAQSTHCLFSLHEKCATKAALHTNIAAIFHAT